MKKERTLINVKSEAIQRHLIGEMISKFERRGLKLVAAKLIAPTAEQIGRQYPNNDSWLIPTGAKSIKGYVEKGVEPPAKTPREVGRWVRQSLIDYFTDRPLLLMVWAGPHAVELGRKTVGATNPIAADIGSIRGDYSLDSYELSDGLGRAIQTLVHASGSPKEAREEIKLWFKDSEILDYDLVDEKVIYETDWGKVRRKENNA